MISVVQGTAEWHRLRIGKVTASRVSDVVAKIKSGWGASRYNYAAELILERLTGKVAENGFKSADMARGNEVEPMARAAYEFHRGVDVAEIGFVPHPRLGMAGASPDGLVGDDGQLELKCPKEATHLEALMGASIPKGYRDQMQWNLACTGRKWVDYVSFHPSFPESMCLHVQRVMRDDAYIKELEFEVAKFLSDEVDAPLAKIRAQFGVELKAAA